MTVNVSFTIHSIDQLDAVQLGNLTTLLIHMFNVLPAVVDDTMSVVISTDNLSTTVLGIEALQSTLARRFSRSLWISVALNWPPLSQP